MAYQSLYRKWRPKTFDDVIGQSHITATLKNEILSGKTAHAYLFCGTRGTGKTSCARIFAKAVNCTSPDGANPCCNCDVCTGIDSGSVLDVIEIDAASNNSVDNIREIKDEVAYHPSQTKYKVYIIDEVHMLSTGAFNALLKTLEEPPEHVIFILATTESHKLPATITSRCQRFDFKRISVTDIIKRLREVCYNDSIKIDEDSLELIANMADGALRDALSILDRCAGACSGNITLDAAEAVLGIAPDQTLNFCVDRISKKDAGGILQAFDDILANGRDLTNFINTVMRRFRDIMVYKTVKAPEKLFEYSKEALASIKTQSEVFSNTELSYILRTLNTALNDAKFSKNPRIIYELAMFRLCDETIDSDPDALIRRIEVLEAKLKNGSFTVQTPQPVKEEPVKAEAVLQTQDFDEPVADELPPWDTEEPPMPETPVFTEPPMPASIKKEDLQPAEAPVSSTSGADWPAVLDQIKKSSPALFGTLSVKKAIIFENKLYIPNEIYLKTIISSMQQTLNDACMTVLGFIPTIVYSTEAEIAGIVQKRMQAIKSAPPPPPIKPSEAEAAAESRDDASDFDPLDELLNLSEDIHIE